MTKIHKLVAFMILRVCLLCSFFVITDAQCWIVSRFLTQMFVVLSLLFKLAMNVCSFFSNQDYCHLHQTQKEHVTVVTLVHIIANATHPFTDAVITASYLPFLLR